MALCRCGYFGLILGFIIVKCVAQDATSVGLLGNENSIEEEKAIDNLYNNTVYSNISTKLENDVTERTDPSINVPTLSGINSTDSNRHSNSDTSSSSFIELYNTTSNDSAYITKQQYGINWSLELQPTSSADLERSSSDEFSNNDYHVIPNNNNINESSRDITDLDDLLNTSISEFPTTIAFNNISTVNNMNKDITIRNRSTSFTSTTENMSTKFTDTGITESYSSLLSTERTDNALSNIKDITATSLVNESLNDTISPEFVSDSLSPTEPNLAENRRNTAYSNESNNLTTRNATTDIYEMIENESMNASNISSRTNPTSVTLGLHSLLKEETTGSYDSSSLSEGTTSESSKIYPSTELHSEINDNTLASTAAPHTTGKSFNSLSHSTDAITKESSVSSSLFEETDTSFSSIESAVHTEIHNSTNYSFIINSTSIPLSTVELSSHTLNETENPHSFGKTGDEKSSTYIGLDSVETESYDTTLFTLEPQVDLVNASDQSTHREPSKITTIDHIVSETPSDRINDTFHHLSFNITDDAVESTSPFSVLLNSTVKITTNPVDFLGSYNESKGQPSSSTTDNGENVSEQFPLMTSSLIINVTSSPDDTIMNLTESNESETSTSYSKDITNVTEKEVDSSEKSYNFTVFGLTESIMTTITPNVSELVTEYNASDLISTASTPSSHDPIIEFTSTTGRYSTEDKSPMTRATSGVSPLSTNSTPDFFHTTFSWLTSLERNESSKPSSFETTQKYSTSISDSESTLSSHDDHVTEFTNTTSMYSAEEKSSTFQPSSEVGSSSTQSTPNLFHTTFAWWPSVERNESSTPSSFGTTQNYSTSISDSPSTLSSHDDHVTEFRSTTSRYSTGEKSSTVQPSSAVSSSSTQSTPNFFVTTFTWWPSIERNESSTPSFGTTENYSTSISESERPSTMRSTIATPTDVTKKVNKCLTNVEEMKPEITVTVLFSLPSINLQEEIKNDKYEIRFQQSALSCFDTQFPAIKNHKKNEEAYQDVSVENRNEYADSDLHSERSIVCISPEFTSTGQTFSITFYVREIINGSEKVISANIIAQSLKSCKSQIEQDVGLNLTDIFENLQVSTLPSKDDIREESILQRHASLFISLSLVLGLLLIFGTVAFVYFYCCSHSRHYDTEKKKLKKDMSASVEIGDMISANEILNGEIAEKEMFGLSNGSRSHLIKMDDDGWVVPYSEIPLEEKNPPDVQDTKL